LPVTRGWLRSIFALLGTFFLLLPTIGPILDHHFVQREPNHYHIYLGTVVPEHTHPYQEHHTHRPASLDPNGSVPDNPVGAPDILYLTSQDGLGLSVTPFSTPVVLLEMVYSDPGDVWSLSRQIHHDGILISAFTPPPDRPPQS